MSGRDALERVLQHLITTGALVDREIAFEHQAQRAEGGDAGLDLRAPGLYRRAYGLRCRDLVGRWSNALASTPKAFASLSTMSIVALYTERSSALT